MIENNLGLFLFKAIVITICVHVLLDNHCPRYGATTDGHTYNLLVGGVR